MTTSGNRQAHFAIALAGGGRFEFGNTLFEISFSAAFVRCIYGQCAENAQSESCGPKAHTNSLKKSPVILNLHISSSAGLPFLQVLLSGNPGSLHQKQTQWRG